MWFWCRFGSEGPCLEAGDPQQLAGPSPDAFARDPTAVAGECTTHHQLFQSPHVRVNKYLFSFFLTDFLDSEFICVSANDPVSFVYMAESYAMVSVYHIGIDSVTYEAEMEMQS